MTATITAERPPEPGTPTRVRTRAVLVPILLVLAGLSVLLYPVVATQWNNYHQRQAAERYSEIEQERDPVLVRDELESAKRYNETHEAGPILDPWLARVSEDNVAYQEYLRELSGQSAMGRVIVPTAEADLPIYHGTSEDTLNRGAGHLYGSDLPVGGPGTHSLITAHTGLTNATLFDNLTKVREGDAFYLQVAGERMKYEVDQIEVVLPTELDELAVVPDRDLVALITCTPYGINSHRLLVRGHRVPLEASDASAFEGTGTTWQWWMYAIIAGALVVLLLLAWWLRRLFGGRAKNDTDTGSGTDTGGEHPTDDLESGFSEGRFHDDGESGEDR